MAKKHPKFKWPAWTKSALISVVVLPVLVFSWHNLQAIWASPAKLETVTGKVESQATTQEQIEQLILEQKARQDKQEAVTDAQVKALNAQLQLISEMKKR